MPNHQCIQDKRQFCFVCASYVNQPKKGKRRFFNELAESRYKEIFKVKNIKNLNKWFVPVGICETCRKAMERSSKKGNKFRFIRPAVWRRPKDAKSCYLCCTSKHRVKFDEKNFNSQTKLNVILPKHFLTKIETKIKEKDSNLIYLSSDESEVDE